MNLKLKAMELRARRVLMTTLTILFFLCYVVVLIHLFYDGGTKAWFTATIMSIAAVILCIKINKKEHNTNV